MKIAVQQIVQIIVTLGMLGVSGTGLAQCYVDPYTGRQICTPPSAGWRPDAGSSRSRLVVPELPSSSVGSAAHCRIRVDDGSTGSGTLVAADESLGLVLTCAHLFDESTSRIVVSFSNGTRFAARLIDRDSANDLAALSIRRPAVEPIEVSAVEPAGLLTACGFGPNGQFRSIRARIVGKVMAVGAEFASLTIDGAVRPGDSGGAVLNAAGELVGIIWGQRDGLTYTTCGRPLQVFLGRLRGKPFVAADAPSINGAASPQPPSHNPQHNLHAWSAEIESRIRALDEKKQDKGDYLQAGALKDYLRIADASNISPDKFASRAELDGRLKMISARCESVHSRVESVQQRLKQVASSNGGFFQGLSLGKLLVGALGLSGPFAAAVVVAGGLAGRLKRSPSRAKTGTVVSDKAALASRELGTGPLPQPIAVDSPPPPQRAVPETHYVSVEKDSFAKAHQWASEHVARKYPGATEVLQAQDSLIKQFMAAQ